MFILDNIKKLYTILPIVYELLIKTKHIPRQKEKRKKKKKKCVHAFLTLGLLKSMILVMILIGMQLVHTYLTRVFTTLL